MPRTNLTRLHIALYILLFLAATFAIMHITFWTEEGSIAEKPGKPDTVESSKASSSGRTP